MSGHIAWLTYVVVVVVAAGILLHRLPHGWISSLELLPGIRNELDLRWWKEAFDDMLYTQDKKLEHDDHTQLNVKKVVE